MPSKETKIWLAIRSRIELFLPSLPKAWPGMVFDSVTEPYIRVGRVSVAPVSVLIDSNTAHRRTGAIVLTVVYPVGQKSEVYEELGGSIAAFFHDGLQMSHQDACVTVTSYPHVQEGYLDNGYWAVPVSIPWRCFL